ncbi:IBR domain containing protein [Acanthamoeba castellanii str. Neff]|uniref:RBR-type E3 ubiquitin transferase n=1 Tax=Acanthamoeba castellanii (strain ATCC 30010 / Neff) TaxID=1257118 RepID=L8HIB3_ACACF|nr:IBR domain containing protein [Acanthamoeba castellanii str. Neff]ELR24111.1 IBR domain containing protein [Acanthamoeba castellanii str. Neff]
MFNRRDPAPSPLITGAQLYDVLRSSTEGEEEDLSFVKSYLLLSSSLQPGFAPSSLFSSDNMRNSTRLDGMRNSSVGLSLSSSGASAPPLRVSQLVNHDQVGGDADLRVSAVTRQVNSLQQVLDEGQAGGFSSAQSNVISIHLGNIFEMQSKLTVLINQYIDDPERLATFLLLHESISDAIQSYEATIAAQFGDDDEPPPREDEVEREHAQWARQFSDTDEEQSTEKEEEEEEEEEDDMNDEDEDHEGSEEKECVICMDDFWWPGKRGYELKCGCLYCKPCLRSNYDVLINDGQVLKLTCPNPTCAAPVDEDDLKNILTNKQFLRYQQFFLLASLRNDPTVRWCPRVGCETAEHGSEEDCHMTCSKCSTEFCWKCNLEWHPGITCDQAKVQAQKGKQKVTRQEKRAEKYIKKHSRPCPQCLTPIQKNEGCAGLQFKPASRLLRGIKKTGQIGAYAGIAVGVTAGVVVVTPIALAVGIPTLAIGLPIYGAYKIVS